MSFLLFGEPMPQLLIRRLLGRIPTDCGLCLCSSFLSLRSPAPKSSCMILVYLLESYLGLPQHMALLSLPAAIKSVTSQENFIQSRFYMLDKRLTNIAPKTVRLNVSKSHKSKVLLMHLIREATNVKFDCMILLQGWLPWLWKMSKGFIAVLGFRTDNEILQSLAIFSCYFNIFTSLCITTVWTSWLCDAIKDLYRSFGFEKQPIVIGFVIFQQVILPIQCLFSLSMKAISRSSEFKEQNLSSINADHWFWLPSMD
ncbi:hypothetical protein M9H77_32619 [Catharanthus roseus]|uniref:Uncharacterized protein n=1 Tax=Catharanthus roseus TaxID=4058 RepID=A0ACC0A4P2_CATRO|nr:hypothetical protein M9H77_32619 [Catharanthus roseus]